LLQEGEHSPRGASPAPSGGGRDVNRAGDRHGGVCVVTAITECPDVRGVEPRGGASGSSGATELSCCSHLAVSSSHGEVALVNFF